MTVVLLGHCSLYLCLLGVPETNLSGRRTRTARNGLTSPKLSFPNCLKLIYLERNRSKSSIHSSYINKTRGVSVYHTVCLRTYNFSLKGHGLLVFTPEIIIKFSAIAHDQFLCVLKVIPQFCFAHFYCAHLITYNFIHYTYRLKKKIIL
jgi:hypothetical protein